MAARTRGGRAGGTAAGRAAGGRGSRAAVTAALAALAAGGCELTETELAPPPDVIVAEAHLTLLLGPGGGAPELDALAYLHRSQNRAIGPEVSGAAVRLSGERGGTAALPEMEIGDCLLPFAEEELDSEAQPRLGTCYRARIAPSPVSPGEMVRLEVSVPDGRILSSASRIPGGFSFRELSRDGQGRCRLKPETNQRLQWTPSEHAWTYLAETRIEGLPEALAGRDVEVADSVRMIGFSVGRDDTDIVFPSQFGFVDYFDDEERDLVRILQKGLPRGARAEIVIVAIDRNWVNWGRGGSFHPSGEVRIPSVFGDGTGFFGTGIERRLRVVAAPEGEGLPPLCGTAEGAARLP